VTTVQRRAILATAALLLAPRAQAGAPPTARSDAMDPTPNAICIGRFSLSPPPGWVLQARTQKMYLTDLDDAPPPPAPGSSDPVLDRLRQGLPSKTPLIRRFELDGVGPAAWFGLGSADSFDRRLVVLSGPLRMQLLSGKGREAPAERAMRMIAPGYRAGARTGFCLARGAMHLEPSRNESTSLTLAAQAWPDTLFSLQTRTVDKPDETHPLAQPEAELSGMAGSGVSVNLSSQSARTVAGLAGRELRGQMRASATAAPFRLYRFFHPGVGRQSGAPLMTLELDGPATEGAALDQAWNALLDSLRPLPLR
jgi:hypothetical protein